MFKNQKTTDKFRVEAEKIINHYKIPGVAVGIEKNQETSYQMFGYRNVEEQLIVDGDTIFGIASMTKSITCLAIMKLQESGKLSVNDPVIKHLPNFKTPNADYTKDITIHHLMTHTAGFPPLPTNLYTRMRAIAKDPSVKDYVLNLTETSGDPIDTPEELVQFLSELDYRPLGEPGKEFSYSNDSYALLGMIIKNVSGQTYEEYVTESILQPLGMTNSTFFSDDFDKIENVTTLYAKNKQDEVYAAPIWWNVTASRAAGALKSTVNDILKYLEIYKNDGKSNGVQIISKESVDQMIYPHVKVEPGKYYGYGLRITPDFHGSTLVEHGGGSKGVSSFMTVIPEQGLSGVILTNLAGVPAPTILMGALNVLNDLAFNATDRTFAAYDAKKEHLIEYVGTYTSEEGMKFTFSLEDDQLYAIDGGTREKTKLQPIAKDEFLDDTDSFVKFIRDGQAKVIKVFSGSRQIFKDRE